MNKLIVYTDGGSRGNPGLGAWAFAIWKEGEIAYKPPIARYTNYDKFATNNEMELTAIFKALNHILTRLVIGTKEVCNIEVRSDSQYCIMTITQWAPNWIKNGTMDNRKNRNLIIDIIHTIQQLSDRGHIITFKKVAGHTGEYGNDYVDRLLNHTMDNAPSVLNDPVQDVAILPEVRFMRIPLDIKKEHSYAVDKSFHSSETDHITVRPSDIVLVMRVGGKEHIIQSFRQDWFVYMFETNVSRLPVFDIEAKRNVPEPESINFE